MVAWMAPEVAPAWPQLWPESMSHAQHRSSTATAMWNRKEPANPLPSRSSLWAIFEGAG